jgi:RNA recognition motif-containing protein
MQQMALAPQSMASCASNPSPGPIMVPVPVPMPFQMPFTMPKFAPQSVPQSVQVPKGFKLVRIPEATPEKQTAPAKSEISNPANTERKIFVGGLNPSTTGQTLREYFATFGAVTDAKVIRDGEKSKGFGFVQFKESIPAEVLEQAHIIDQRRCGVGPAFHRESAQDVVA